MANAINYQAEPTAAKFHACDDFVRAIMGPIGSGKSVACIIELFRRACEQEPDDSGVRNTRWVIVRNTYPELKTTTIKTFQEWLPEEIFKFRWDKPIMAHSNILLPDGTRLNCEIYFMSLDKPQDAKKCLSLEITGAFCNESRELDWATIMALSTRIGRYPGKMFGKLTWAGLIMDTNPPDNDSKYYKVWEVERPEGWSHFTQPAAMIYNDETGVWEENPDAENIDNQPLGMQYYHNIISGGKAHEYLKVHVEGGYGTITDGRPVYPEWQDKIHVASENLEPYRGLPLIVGFDFGLTPACVIAQISPNGQVRILDEICSESAGIRQFITEAVKPLIAERYFGITLQIVGDPAGVQRSQSDEKTCFEEMQLLGMPANPATTNNVMKRLEVVKGRLRTMVDGGPGFLLSPRCDQLRRGFLGNYQYERVRVSGTERYKDAPSKNKYSHVHDALQYAVLHMEPKVESFRGQRREVKKAKFLWA